jgi:tungstate transport system substrate-binding protein
MLEKLMNLMRELQNTRRAIFLASTLIAIAFVTATQAAETDKSIAVASTTSTQDSGLFDYLLPIVKRKTGIDVKVIAQGTGQALDTGRRGDADVVFVHAKPAELKFTAEGESLKRYPVMYNDFVLIGPKSDPAAIAGMGNIVRALQIIAANGFPFVSRGDNSGTHMAELELWKASGVNIDKDGGRGTSPSVKEWVPLSMQRVPLTPMCFLIGPHGFTSKTGATCGQQLFHPDANDPSA